MEILKKRIEKDGTLEEGNILKVDNFLNHQLDIKLLNEIGKELKNRYKDDKIDKILTIETSGIAIAAIVAQYFDVPVVYARKIETKVMEKDTYQSEVYSYTKGKSYTIRVAKKYLSKDERVLLIDDFLAKGKAMQGLINITEEAGAKVVGISAVIEKGFQEGGSYLRNKGYRLESLAIVDESEDGKIKFI